MSDRTVERLGALSGIVGVVMGPIAFALFASGGLAPGPGRSRESLASAVAAPASVQVFFGVSLDTLSSFLLIFFFARLWVRLRRAEGDPGWLSIAALAGAILGIAAGLGDKAAFYALAAQAGHGLEVQEAITLQDIAQGFFSLAGAYTGVLFVGAAALVILRARALPRWLGWGAGAIVVLNLVSLLVPTSVGIRPIGFPLLILWLLATSVVMLVRPETPAVAAEFATQAAVRA